MFMCYIWFGKVHSLGLYKVTCTWLEFGGIRSLNEKRKKFLQETVQQNPAVYLAGYMAELTGVLQKNLGCSLAWIRPSLDRIVTWQSLFTSIFVFVLYYLLSLNRLVVVIFFGMVWHSCVRLSSPDKSWTDSSLTLRVRTRKGWGCYKIATIYRSWKVTYNGLKLIKKSRLLAIERIMDFTHVMQMFRNQWDRCCVSYQIKFYALECTS